MDLCYKYEKPLFWILYTLSILFWVVIIVGTFGIALLYLGLFFVLYLFAQSALISYLKGTGVRVTAEQFPDLHASLEACCRKLAMVDRPEMYLLHADGAFNAFATRFLRRHYLVLFSDIVDALDERPQALRFYIGHELGHIHRKHLYWGPVLAPAAILPLIGAAYSRARESTCDNYGLACVETEDDAIRGLTVLATGSRRWRSINVDGYLDQVAETGGYWMSLHEYLADYPWLVKRVARVRARARNTTPNLPRRHAAAALLACFIPRGGPGGGPAGLLVGIAVFGVLAAIAIPQFALYRQRGFRARVESQIRRVSLEQEQFFAEHDRYAASLRELGFSPVVDSVTIVLNETSADCYAIEGSHPSLKMPVRATCDGIEPE